MDAPFLPGPLDRELLIDFRDPDPLIICARYRLPPLDSAPKGASASNTGSRDTLAEARNDPLEAAWREINGSPRLEIGGNGDGESEDWIGAGCATVVSGAVDGKQGRRELWVYGFSVEAAVFSGLTSLEGESLFRAGPEYSLNQLAEIKRSAFRLSDLLHCPRHGASLSCLGLSHSKVASDPDQPGPSQPCDVRFQPVPDVKTAWSRFGHALLEKVAWRKGRRVLGSSIGPRVDIRADRTLLLAIHARHSLRRRNNKHVLKGHDSPHGESEWRVLLPLGLPALFVASFSPDAAQTHQLEASFTTLLGHAWTEGKAAQSLAAAMKGREDTGWSILWMPRYCLALDDLRLHTSQWADLPQETGLLTIWPSHLAPTASSRLDDSARGRPPLPLVDAPSNADILSTSTALFDFLSSYKPPSPVLADPEDEDEDIPELPGNGVGGSNALEGITPASVQPHLDPTPIPFPTTSGEEPQVRDDGEGSDMDDLFSTHSASPTPVPALENAPAPAAVIRPVQRDDRSPRIQDFEDLFGDTREAEPDFPDSAPDTTQPDQEPVQQDREAGARRFRGYMDGEAENEGQMVTEDDFDFFDSSPLQGPADVLVSTESPAEQAILSHAAVPAASSPRDAHRANLPENLGQPPAESISASESMAQPSPTKRGSIISIGRTESDEIIGSHDIGSFDSFQGRQPSVHVSQETDAYVSQRSSVEGPSIEISPAILAQQQRDETVNLQSKPELDARPGRADGTSIPEPEMAHEVKSAAAVTITRGKKRKTKDVELIEINTVPSPYSALDMPTPITYTSHLLSPAPTPESHALRPEMMDYLRSSAPRGGLKVDYAAQWAYSSDMDGEEGDMSGAGEGEDWTLPPTPESDTSYSDLDSETEDEGEAGGAKRRKIAKESKDGQVFWSGKRVVGAELVVLCGRAEESSEEGLSVKWGEVEGTGSKTTGMPTPAPDDTAAASPSDVLDVIKKRLAEICLDKLAREVIDNYSLRDHLLHSDSARASSADWSSQADDGSTELLEPAPVPVMHFQAPLRIHVGYGGNVTQLSIAALQYWRQIGLGPVGGPKNVALEVYCPSGQGMIALAESFIAGLKEMWRVMGMGSLTAEEKENGARCFPITEGGDAAILEAAAVRERESPLFTLIIPLVSDDLPLSSFMPILTPAYLPSATCIVHPLPLSSLYAADYSSLALSMYNRLPKPVLPVWTRPAFLPRPAAYLQHPSFSLAPDEPPKVEISLEWPLASYDLLGKWRGMHLAYGWDAEVGAVVGMILDGAGEEWGVRTWVWGTLDGEDEQEVKKEKDTGRKQRSVEWKEILQAVWTWAVEWASVRAIEWRMTICREGIMNAEELTAWQTIHEDHRKPISLLMTVLPDRVELAGWPTKTASTVLPAVLADAQSKLVDLSLFGTSHRLAERPLLSLPSSAPSSSSSPVSSEETKVVIPRSGFLLALDAPSLSDATVKTNYFILSHRPVPGKGDEDADAIIARDYYRLACLARKRFGFQGAGGPVHLEGVRAVFDAMWAYGVDGQ